MEDEKDSKVSEVKVISNWKRLLVPIFLIISVIGLVYLVNLSDKWFVGQKITEYEIDGLSLNDSKKFFEEAKKISYGKTKDSVLLEKIELELEKDAYIKKCVATFASQSKIHLQIEERYPFAFYMDGGELKYIDQDGVILPYKVLKNYSDLILVSGFAENDSIQKASVLKILKILSNEQNVFDFVSEIRYVDSNKGFEIIGPYEYTRIFIGTDDRINQKLKNLSVLMNDKSARKLLSSVKVIDLRWQNRIVIEEI